VLLNFLEELGLELDCNGNILNVDIGVSKLNLIGVNQVLGEQSKMLKKLVHFRHENHWQMHERVNVVAHPCFCLYFQ
jgi:hypothetical protein